jgi:hypothetical protein
LPKGRAYRLHLSLGLVNQRPRAEPPSREGLPPDLQTLAANSPTSRDEERRVSPRALHAFATLREQLGAPMAAFAIFGQASQDLLNALALAEKG